jgi:serine/threonine protein kinase
VSEPLQIRAYVVGERLGGGGFGEVFAATHNVVGRDVAIKILHANRCTDPDAVRRFLDEARAVNKIRHKSIVDIFDFGQLEDGRYYLVMERILGRTLRQILDAGPIPRARAIEILRAIATAVDAVHAVGIAHRDLKPDNVFILPDGEIKLIDFGLAKLSTDSNATESTLVMGTPLYMAPEQCRGASADTRCDLYAFGALAYHLLTHTTVFSGDPLSLALHHVNDLPQPPSRRAAGISSNVDAALLALLAKDPALRPSPLAAVVDRLAAPVRARQFLPDLVAQAIVVAIVISSMRPTAVAPTISRLDPSTVKVTRLALDEMIWPYPWLSFDGTQLVSWKLDKGGAIRDLATGTVTPVQVPMGEYHTRLPDGRWVSSLQMITVEDPHVPGGLRTLTRGILGEASPCGDQIAFFDGGWLKVITLASGEITDLATAQTFGVRWSPDCRRLAYGTPEAKVRVVEISTHQVTELPHTVLGTLNLVPAAFLDPDTVAYCAESDAHPSLMLHRLAIAEPDSVIARLDPSTTSCHLANASQRKRVVVIEDIEHTTPAIFDLGADHPIPKRVGEEGAPITGLELVDHSLLVTRSSPLTLERIDLDRGTTTPLRTCPGEVGVMRRAGGFVHVVHDHGALQLSSDPACSVIEEWSLPYPDGWSMPSCAANRCVVARAEDQRFTIYELDRGRTKEIGSFADPPSAGEPVVPRVALLANGTVVGHTEWSGRYGVFDLDSRHHVVTLDEGNSVGTGGFVASPGEAAFYADGHNLDVRAASIARIAADDSRTVIYDPGPADDWRTQLSVRAISADGHTLAVVYGRREHGLLIVDAP